MCCSHAKHRRGQWRDWVPGDFQVLALVKASGTHIQSVRGWRTVTALISMTALHPEAAPLAFDALSAMVRADTLSPAAFQPALDTAFHFAERHSKVTPSPLLPLSEVEVALQ